MDLMRERTSMMDDAETSSNNRLPCEDSKPSDSHEATANHLLELTEKRERNGILDMETKLVVVGVSNRVVQTQS